MAQACAAAIVAMVAVASGSSVAAAQGLTQMQGRVRGVPPAVTLPAATDPLPYRQTGVITCTHDDASNTDVCLLPFDKIDDGRQLQLDNIACATPNAGGAFLLRTARLDISPTNIVAVFPTGNAGSIALGPFHFQARERPTVFTTAGVGATVICAISGFLSRTN